MASRECPNCHSKRNWRDGLRETSFNSIQRFICRDCGFRFSEKSYKDCLLTESSQLCAIIEEAKKLDTATEIKTVAGDGKANLIEYAWRLKKKGLQDNTIATRTYLLSQLIKKGADLHNPETVETILATEPMSNAMKRNYSCVYCSFTKTFKIAWEPIKIHYEPKQPFIPTREELNALISASGKCLAAFLQVALDTGARIGEICRLNWTDVNAKNKTISINEPEKHSRARTLPVTDKTISMIQALPKKHGKHIFNPKPRSIRVNFDSVRKRLAENQKNPQFLQIHIHSFRHFFACNLYRKTKILKIVQDALGHRSIMNTEIYTRLVVFREEEYCSTTAKTVEECCKLAEDGWTFFVEVDGIKVFRKTK